MSHRLTHRNHAEIAPFSGTLMRQRAVVWSDRENRQKKQKKIWKCGNCNAGKPRLPWYGVIWVRAVKVIRNKILCAILSDEEMSLVQKMDRNYYKNEYSLLTYLVSNFTVMYLWLDSETSCKILLVFLALCINHEIKETHFIKYKRNVNSDNVGGTTFFNWSLF